TLLTSALHWPMRCERPPREATRSNRPCGNSPSVIEEVQMMRAIHMSSTLVLTISGSLFAQEWIEFANRDDRFTCNFPSQPKVTQTTYKSDHGADLPARVYTVRQGQSRH